MNSYRPYLIRALHEWICDNGLTPHLLVDAEAPGVSVPPSAVQDGRVVLNVAPRAVMGFSIDQDFVHFSARFGGVSHDIWVPIDAVLAIYARENGQGMMIPEDPLATPEPADAADDYYDEGLQNELLSDAELATDRAEPPARVPLTVLSNDDIGTEGAPDPDAPPTSPTPPRGKGFLRVVK